MSRKSYHHERLSPAHEALLGAVRPNTRVLDIGCATGVVTRALKELGCRVTGVEVSEEMAHEAASHADEIIVGDISRAETRGKLSGPYDCVVFADVLEHLVDPWETLRWAREVLADGGCVLASLPNVAYYEVRLGLLAGRFEYTRFGILDDTHLRFFTLRTAKQLFIDSGYAVTEVAWVNAGKRRIPARIWPEMFALQFVLKGTPAEIAC